MNDKSIDGTFKHHNAKAAQHWKLACRYYRHGKQSRRAKKHRNGFLRWHRAVMRLADNIIERRII